MKTLLRHKSTRSVILLAVLFPFCSDTAFARSGFEFYFWGQNIKSFQDSDWLNATARAVVSLCIQELGHALYLEAIGKSWNLDASVSSGFSIQPDENLSDAEWSNFGRAGFAFQSLVGTGLTVFEKTRHWDFTKDWVAMNTVRNFSYQGRHHENDGVWARIESGGGAGDLKLAAFSILSANNLMRLENDLSPPLTQPEAAADFHLSDDFLGSDADGNAVLVAYPDSRLSLQHTSALELPPLILNHPQ